MHSLNKLAVLALAAGISFSLATAQTTGVPNVNDLTVRLPPTFTPQGSGAMSCNLLPGTYGPTPFVAAYELSATPGMPTMLLLSLGTCTPAFFPFPTGTVGCAGPLAGTPPSNIWLSLVPIGPFPITVPGIPSTTGMTRWNFTIPGGAGTLWTQAMIFDPCAPWGFKFSQAQGFTW